MSPLKPGTNNFQVPNFNIRMPISLSPPLRFLVRKFLVPTDSYIPGTGAPRVSSFLSSPPPFVSMSRSCKQCTFINSPSSKTPNCAICLFPLSPSSSSSFVPSPTHETPTWSCKVCTFLNPFKNAECEICGARASLYSLSSFEDLTDTSGVDGESLDSSIGSVFLPLRPCKRKIEDPVVCDDDSVEMKSFSGLKPCKNMKDGGDEGCVKLGGFQGFRAATSKAVTIAKDESKSGAISGSIKILSYNVWFREDLEVHKRMKALGDLIQLHSPDVICFQEITPDIYDILRHSSWWKTYSCSVSAEMAHSGSYFCMQLCIEPVKSFNRRPFSYSAMGRELSIVEVEVPGSKSLVVATSHLESPCPSPPKWDQMYSKERVAQAKEATTFLSKNPNVIFCGDMNWDDKLDGQFPLPDGWVDAWTELKPGEDGWTYDTKSNKMLSGNRALRKRLDRFLCCLRDFKINEIKMIGTEAIPGVSYVKEKKVRGEVKMLELPVLPSDHYGLLLTISAK